MEEIREGLNNCHHDSSMLRNTKFSKLYENICERIRRTGILEDFMTNFQQMHDDLMRVSFSSEIEELQLFDLRQEKSFKDSKEALKQEQLYNESITNETNARAAFVFISKSIQLSPHEDVQSLAERYMKRGWASLLENNFEDALLDASQCLSLGCDPIEANLWNAFEIKGHCHAKFNEYMKAEDAFKKALEMLRSGRENNSVKAKAASRMALVMKNIKGQKKKKVPKIRSERQESKNQAQNLPPLTNGQHKILKSASSNVKVVSHENKGRSMIATKEFLPGDVIIVEKPLVAVLSTWCLDTHCTHCFSRLRTPRPCTICSMAWFCDEKCLEKGAKNHKMECCILHLLHDQSLGSMGPLVFRLLSDQKWQNLKSQKNYLLQVIQKEEKLYLQEISSPAPADERNQSAKDWRWNEGKSYSSDDYATAFHLVTNSEKRSFGDMFKRSIGGLYIAHCLKRANFFESAEVEKSDFLFVAALALRHLQSSSCNAYEVTEFETGTNGILDGSVVGIGGAIYPTISLTNHSCWPNTTRYCSGSSCIVRATRTITKGDEILDNYGYHFYNTNILQRKSSLGNQYKFDCRCQPCEEEWPEFPHRQENFVFHCPDPECRRPSAYLERKQALCPLCGNAEQYNQLLMKIKKHLQSFEKGLDFMREGNIPAAIGLLRDRQIFLDAHSSPPSKHCTEVEKTFRHCLGTLGNLIQKQSRML